LLAEPAAHYVAAHGGKIHTGHAISSITRHGTRYCIDDDTTHYDHVVLAVAPHHLLRLIETLPELDRLGAVVNAFSYEPIVTCYLRYPPETKLPQVMTGFTDAHAHWVFDRGQIDGNDGLISAVISAEGKHRELDRETLAYTIDAELRTYYPWLPRPLSHLVITEKRATFACTPNLQRPTTHTDLPGVWLAGDYVASDYPATIEGAVRSGLKAATAIITAASIHQAA
jgi:predicted NAD/FAD-binding protein